MDTDTYIGKEDALRLQADGLPMTTVVQEVFKAQELESTHLLLFFPDQRDRQLTRLQQTTHVFTFHLTGIHSCILME